MYTILIVDDEFPARKMFRRVLDQCQSGQYKIVGEATNGQVALDMVRSLHPDIIITDIQMPILDGIALIRTVKETAPEQVFIILSCYESFSYAQQAIRLGVTDYLVKDTLSVQQVEQCLALATQNMEEKSPARPAPEADTGYHFEQLKQLYPIHLAPVESRLDKLCNMLSAHDFSGAAGQIQRLYQTNFEGITQYYYLKHINDFLFTKLRSFCELESIPAEEIFGTMDNMDEVLLQSVSPQAVCDLICQWVGMIETACAEPRQYSVRIRSVIAYINENYFRDISLQTIADTFSVHKVYLARTFKIETGQTLNEYVNAIRIEKAQLLLSVTDAKVGEIALTVGFNNSQNFYATFKKYANCSPLEYRDNIRK